MSNTSCIKVNTASFHKLHLSPQVITEQFWRVGSYDTVKSHNENPTSLTQLWLWRHIAIPRTTHKALFRAAVLQKRCLWLVMGVSSDWAGNSLKTLSSQILPGHSSATWKPGTREWHCTTHLFTIIQLRKLSLLLLLHIVNILGIIFKIKTGKICACTTDSYSSNQILIYTCLTASDLLSVDGQTCCPVTQL